MGVDVVSRGGVVAEYVGGVGDGEVWFGGVVSFGEDEWRGRVDGDSYQPSHCS